MPGNEVPAANAAGVRSRPGPAREDRWCPVMGILNVTPDSFSDGGRNLRLSQAIDHGLVLPAQAPTSSTWAESRRVPARRAFPPSMTAVIARAQALIWSCTGVLPAR